MVAARKLIKAGCEQCQKSEDIWLEAARLHVSLMFTYGRELFIKGLLQNTQDAKIILANAVQHVPQSVKVWLTAASLEQEVKSKKRVLRKG